MQQELERKIIGVLIDDALGSGYSISVYDGGNMPIKKSKDKVAILAAMFSVDEEELIFYKDEKRVGWVLLVHGNGRDVIADNSSKIEHILVNATTVATENWTMYEKWITDECQDAEGHWTIRIADETDNGDLHEQPIATFYELQMAEHIVVLHNDYVEGLKA